MSANELSSTLTPITPIASIPFQVAITLDKSEATDQLSFTLAPGSTLTSPIINGSAQATFTVAESGEYLLTVSHHETQVHSQVITVGFQATIAGSQAIYPNQPLLIRVIGIPPQSTLFMTINSIIQPFQVASAGLYRLTPPPVPGIYDLVLTCEDQSITVVMEVLRDFACLGDVRQILCLDGSRLGVSSPGIYRLFGCLDTTPILINVEVIKDTKTLEYCYRKVWIKLEAKCYTLEFSNGTIRVKSTQTVNCFGHMRQMETDHGSQTEWEHIDSTYQLKCDGSQPLMTLRVGKRGDQRRCQGLLAGQLMTVSHLKDTSNKANLSPISFYQYQESEILYDGMKPAGTYCLIQTLTLVCHVQVGKDGRLEKASLKVGEKEMEWNWESKPVPLYQHQSDEYLLRVQSDRCISVAMYRGGVVA